MHQLYQLNIFYIFIHFPGCIVGSATLESLVQLVLCHQINNWWGKCTLEHQNSTLLQHRCVWRKKLSAPLDFCFPCLVLQISAPRICLAPPIYGCYVSPWRWPSWKVKGDPFLCHLRGQFRPTVCELYPRHPITKDSCILKASGDPWRTERAWCSQKKEKKATQTKK